MLTPALMTDCSNGIQLKPVMSEANLSNGSDHIADHSTDALVQALRSFAETLIHAVDIVERDQPESHSKSDRNFYELVRAFEVRLIREALTETNGNQTRAAELLGLKITTLNNKIKQLK